MTNRMTGKIVFALLCSMVFSLPAAAQEEIYDPFEPVNRAIFTFNDKFDVYLAEPVARTYDDLMPDLVQQGITNFFYNLAFPTYLVSDLMQLEFRQAVRHTGRFALNTTMGIAGFIDVAKRVGLEHRSADIGTAFASWGIPAGPYIVLPILGPSTARDAVGLGVEVFLSPWFWIAAGSDLEHEEVYGYSLAVMQFIDTRTRLLEAVDAAKDSSLDYYLFTQSAYYQYRQGLLRGERGKKDDEWLEAEDEDAWLAGEEE